MVLGTRGKVIWWVKIGCQECRIEVTLDRTYATGTVVKPLSKGLLDIRPTAVTVLGQLGGARGELVQGAAGACNRASQVVYEHPWSTQAHALAELLLPASISNLFDTDVVADSDNLVDKPSMQALAVGGKLAFLVGKSASRGKVAFAILPGEACLAMLLDTAFFVVVLWVVGTTLAVQLAL
jgi:hypothetical protein